MKKQELKLRKDLQCLVNDYFSLTSMVISKNVGLYSNNKFLGNFNFTEICISKDSKYVYFYEHKHINFTMKYEDFKGKFKLGYYSDIAKQIFYDINF